MPRRPSKQLSLFDAPQANSLTVTEVLAYTKPQDKQQAAFHRLIKQIHTLRTEIGEWQAYQVRHHQNITTKLTPLYTEIRKKRIEMAHLLDKQFHQKNAIRGKRLRAKLQAMIVELTRDLLLEKHDEALVALHDRHSDFTHEEDKGLGQALVQDLVQNIFGVELDADSTDGSFEDMIFKAQQKQAQDKEARAAKRASKKSAKASAAEEKRALAEEKRAVAAKEASQSVRDVYRKLASALHPDRAGGDLTPERKTELMQRVNKAYDQGNLLELLNIQLEIEQIDADHLTNLSAERLAHYVQVLREQVAELQAERAALVAPFQSLVPYARNLMPSHVDLSIDAEVVRVREELRILESDLAAFADPKYLAKILKDYETEDGLDPFLALSAMLDSMGMPPGPGPRPTQRRRRKA